MNGLKHYAVNVHRPPGVNNFWLLPTGSEPDVRDHRGMLGPRRRGAVVGGLRGRAHWSDSQDGQQHYLRRPHLHRDVSHERGPTSQRVQHLNG